MMSMMDIEKQICCEENFEIALSYNYVFFQYLMAILIGIIFQTVILLAF